MELKKEVTNEPDYYNSEEIANNYKIYMDTKTQLNKYSETPSIKKLLLNSDNNLEGKRVIDLACGCGDSTRLIVDILKPSELIGLDVSADMINKAQKEFESILTNNSKNKIEFHVRDCSNSELSREFSQFDLVHSQHLLCYASSLDMLYSMCKTMFNLTKPNGGICTGLFDSPFFRFGPDCQAKLDKYGFEMTRVEGVANKVHVKLYYGHVKLNRFLMEMFTFIYNPSVYERIFKEVGFREFEWVPFHLEEDPNMPDKHLFVKDYVENCAIVLFRAVR